MTTAAHRGCMVLAAAAFGLHGTGCSGWGNPWSDQNRVQVQFYAPPGASVTLKKFMGTQGSAIGQIEPHRLEKWPEMCCVFNLKPSKTYEFKYIAAEGLSDVSVYGEIDVHKVKSPEAQKFVAHAFVPIPLPSDYHDAGVVSHYPVRGPSGVGLSPVELEHLRQGDIIRKVYFIADLQSAWHTVRMIDDRIERLRSAETILNTELELIDARYESYRQDSLYADPTADALTAGNDRSGRSARFVQIEATRQRMENTRFDIRNQVEDLLNEKRIRTRLLDSIKIVNRRDSLVLATPENQWEFHDAAEQVSSTRVYPGFTVGPKKAYCTGEIALPPLGEVVVVLRVGGRHMQWGPMPPESTVAMNP